MHLGFSLSSSNRMSLANLCFVVNSLVRNGHLNETTIIAGVAGSDQSISE